MFRSRWNAMFIRILHSSITRWCCCRVLVKVKQDNKQKARVRENSGFNAKIWNNRPDLWINFVKHLDTNKKEEYNTGKGFLFNPESYWLSLKYRASGLPAHVIRKYHRSIWELWISSDVLMNYHSTSGFWVQGFCRFLLYRKTLLFSCHESRTTERNGPWTSTTP